MDIINLVNLLLGVGVIISQVFIVLLIICLFVPRKNHKVLDFLSKNAIKFSFIIAVLSTAGSLFYSNYVGLNPCNFCWWQRIFMYPEVILLGLAWLKKDNSIIDYVLTLAVIGGLFSIYSNFTYYKRISSAFCSVAEPCSTPTVFEFGYITLPMMALTAFALIISLLMVKKFYGKIK